MARILSQLIIKLLRKAIEIARKITWPVLGFYNEEKVEIPLFQEMTEDLWERLSEINNNYLFGERLDR
ncbi:hypothetical protein CMK18_00495 [Candidatus Poribacteria bacterium]|nr:hypothetical protein [Candidatus Poribacteria bacterium]